MSAIFIDRNDVSIGADPEFFVKRGTEFISGHIFPCGSKDKPRRTGHGFVQNDGLALELNIPPAKAEAEFVLNFRGVLNDLAEIIAHWDAKREVYLVAEPVAIFSKDMMDRVPQENKTLGCNPDYNAYTLNANDTPNADGVMYRTGAGHLHIGWTKDAEGIDHFEKCAKLVRQLDYTVGLKTLLFDPEPRRRALYGKAGAFRPKPYGLEYRVPSNAWCASEDIARTMFRGCFQAVQLLNEGRDLDKETEGLARECIDNNKVDWTDKYPKLADLLIG